MTSAARVSVVMAVYNGGAYLAESVQSILDQTYSNLELIVVDDGSVDHTWNTLRRFAERDVRVVLLRNNPNVGVVRSLNRGLQQSSGEIIVRQDADDVSHPERLERQLAFLDSHPDYGLVSAVPQPIDVAGSRLNISGWDAKKDEEIRRKLLDHMCLCGPAIALRRQSFEQAGFCFSEGLDASEDYDLCLRVSEVSKLASLPGALYLYRQHPDSASIQKAHQQMCNKAIALERAIHRRFGANPPADTVAIVARDYLHAAIIAFARNDLANARSTLKKAIEIHEPLLDNTQPLEELVRAYTPTQSVEAALHYTGSVFDNLLPKRRKLARMKSRLVSDLHMAEVFSAAKNQQYRRAKKHAWAGICGAPSWLLNRGVLSLLLKSLLQHNNQR